MFRHLQMLSQPLSRLMEMMTKKQILLLIQINHQQFFQKKKMLVQVGYVKIAKKLTPERIWFAQSAVIQN